MVGLVSHSFPWMKDRLASRRRSHCQIPDTNIHADHFIELLVRWLRSVDFQRNEYIEGFLWFVIPKLGITDGGPMPNERSMLIVTLVGDSDTPIECTDTDLLVSPKGVVTRVGYIARWVSYR